MNKESGLSILLVEQNATLAFDVADVAYLFETGHVVLEGNTDVLRQDDRIRRSYLGY
jgi:branched-chain amino acid transport system ATP-binding protein